MPLFRYACEDCKAENEILVRGGETPHCPACRSTKLTKMMSSFAPMMAGGGGEAPPCGEGGCATGTCPFA